MTVQVPNLAKTHTKRITVCFDIRFVSISAKFGICTVVGLSDALLEDNFWG